MGACDSYDESGLVLLGAPMDCTVSFRPGARFGPQKIREVSAGLEEYSPYLDRHLADYRYYDAGDLIMPPGCPGESLRRLGQVVNKVLAHGKFPLTLGGEHLVSMACISEAAAKHSDLAVLHFDAHADLRQEYLGENLSHATVMRRVVETVGGENLFQLGIRSGTAEEFAFARRSTHFHPFAVLAPLLEIIPLLRGRPVYVTLDIDVVDPAFAPGTGTPEPGGCDSAEIIEALHALGELNLMGMDLVEVCPVYDQSERTSLLAAKLVREAILLFG